MEIAYTIELPTEEDMYELYVDIHVATIRGLSSEIIASLACLIGASLPLTGFVIWYNRKFGKKKRSRSGFPIKNNVGISLKKEIKVMEKC